MEFVRFVLVFVLFFFQKLTLKNLLYSFCIVKNIKWMFDFLMKNLKLICLDEL